MENYRLLTEDEIIILENNGCTAEDWTAVNVAEDFQPNHVRNTSFYGEINLGVFEKNVEITKGFIKHTGINRATLRDVTIGDNCLIENVGCYINNYTIGDDCYIANVSVIETTEGATYGEGNLISVLNEAGDGNAIIFGNLNSQFAAFMVKHFTDKNIKDEIRRLINEDIERNMPERGIIGNNVKIIGTKEITNTVVNDNCEINGASRLSDCSILNGPNDSVYIGTGVICENSIICNGSSIINSVKIQDCFVGEACHISNGFTASQSVFFANSYMSNGEACAAFCGPFSASHHKSSLLIGGQFSFYNAGSNTNFSNHAYKMGPMHYGTLERGSKTASGAYVLMPANIGAFSVCFGKLMNHPDMRCLPFAYLMAYGETMYIVPGRNITTVGLYRDIKKWPKRDKRAASSRKSIINFDWLSPFTVGEIVEGKKILEELQRAGGRNVSSYNFQEYIINASSLRKGIKYYDIALRIYMGAVLKRRLKSIENGELIMENSDYSQEQNTNSLSNQNSQLSILNSQFSTVGEGKWNDLSGLLLPESEELRLLDDIKGGAIESIKDILNRFNDINDHYREYQWRWTYKLIMDYYNIEELDSEAMERIREDYVMARRAWIAEIRKDAQKEFDMGDVEQDVFDDFISKLDHEIDYEE